MTDDLEMRRRRAAYRARPSRHQGDGHRCSAVTPRRGLPDMADAELGRFERFLAMPDPVLQDWHAWRRGG